MNAVKRSVRVRVTTVQDGERRSVDADGEAYLKGGQVYIRYREPGEGLEGVTTILKIEVGQITLMRHGSLRSEQRFAAGRTTSGYYEMANGGFALETATERLESKFENGIGTASWAYSLRVGGEEAGHFQVNLEVREGMKT